MKPNGFMWKKIVLPDGGLICLTENNPRAETIFEGNHNLYRLDKNGDVVWQVQRHEKPGWAWFTNYRKDAEASNTAGPDEIGDCPFMSIWLQYQDGSTNLNFGASPKTATWIMGCKVFAFSIGYTSIKYEINIDTGIATTVLEQMEGRPW